MTEVKFIQDYRGVLTDETFYKAGTVAQLPEQKAIALVAAGRAEYVAESIDYESWTVADLRDKLKSMGLSPSGNKAELISRITG